MQMFPRNTLYTTEHFSVYSYIDLRGFYSLPFGIEIVERMPLEEMSNIAYKYIFLPLPVSFNLGTAYFCI